jgi:uncharacterized membrane protein YphA (DoxX/SURF4 family)
MQIAIAAVWLYEGLWSKLLGGLPHQVEVVAHHPFFNATNAALVLKAIGAVEVSLALWVLSGVAPLYAAVVQTALLVGMNTNGLLFSREVIPDPGGMVVKNFAFLVLVWVWGSHG